MALVTFVLNDFGMTYPAELRPTLVFQPSGPAVGGLNIYAPLAEQVATFSSNGLGSVDLQPNDAIHPATHYKVSILTANGARTQLPWKLFVPSGGGRLADLLKNPANPAAVWIGTTPPENPTPGTWWLNPLTGELAEWKD